MKELEIKCKDTAASRIRIGLVSCSGTAMGCGVRPRLMVGFSVTMLGKLLNS